jgi:two-component system CheB/CheR fusion protein
MSSTAAATGVAVHTRPTRPARATDRTWLERLRALVRLNGQIVWVADADGNILDQMGFSAYTGLRAAAALGWNWLSVIHPKDRASAAGSWTRAVGDRLPYELEVRILGADGDYRRFLVRAAPHLDAAGAVREWVGICTDLTEPLRRAGADENLLEQEREARQAAERDIARLNRLEAERERILDVVAHELRNPLTGIKTVLQMTQRHLEHDEPVSQTQLESLARSVHRMETLVHDLLGAARLKGEGQRLTLGRRDLRELCRHVVHDQRLATGRVVTLVLPRKPAHSDVDTDRMTQVLSNLISNAHKYSPAEVPIVVRLTITGRYGRISVQDDGPGIPLDAQGNLFQRFYRVPGIEAVHDADGGLGLGLSICRELVELHNGHIGVESLPGRGSTFWVTVPLAKPS